MCKPDHKTKLVAHGVSWDHLVLPGGVLAASGEETLKMDVDRFQSHQMTRLSCASRDICCDRLSKTAIKGVT